MRLSLFALACVLPACASADDAGLARRVLPAVRLVGAPPAIDGDLADPGWAKAALATAFTDMQTGRPAPDQTTVRLTYDDQFLYVAFVCRDSQPAGIVGREVVRDALYQDRGDGGNNTEDWVEISLDPFLSAKEDDFSRFAVNPLGTRSARLGGGRGGKAEWSGTWSAAARRTEDGWSAEMRIPWAMLNYPSPRGGKTIVVGINFDRFQYRTQTGSRWSNTGLQNFGDLRGRWEGVEPPRATYKPTLSLLPYSLTFAGDGRPRQRIGVDARYTPTPDLTAVATLNPDFATVENAVQAINFSRSENFVEERRPFFLEGSDYFNNGQFFALGPYFYSNRIPSFDAGVKVYGKLSPVDTVGILATSAFNRRTDIVARYRRDLSATDQAGFFASVKDEAAERDSPGGPRNAVGGVFASTRRGKVGVEGDLVRTSGPEAGGGSGRLNFTYQDSNHFTGFQVLRADDDFRVANGLVFFNGFQGFKLYHNWSREWRKGAWRSFSVDFYPDLTWRLDGRPFQRGGGLDVNFQTRSDMGYSVNLNHTRFENQTDRTIGGEITLGASNRFRRLSVRGNVGTQADRAFRSGTLSGSLRIGKNPIRAVDVSGNVYVQEFDGWTRQDVVSVAFQMSRTKAIGGRLVRQSRPGEAPGNNFYLSFRNAGEAGLETYLLVGDPNAPRTRSQVALKLLWAI